VKGADRSLWDGVNRLATRGWIAERWSGAALPQAFGAFKTGSPDALRGDSRRGESRELGS
jgi:hypothetical protein